MKGKSCLKNLTQYKSTKWLDWHFHYYCLNIVFFSLISSHYLKAIFPLEFIHAPKSAYYCAYCFIFSAYLGQIALLLGFVWFIIRLLSLGFSAYPKILTVFTVLSYISLTALILVDSHLFFIYHFHLNASLWDLILDQRPSQIFAFSKQEYGYGASCFLSIVIVQIALARFAKRPACSPAWLFIPFGALLLSYLLLIASLNQNRNELISQTAPLPLYLTTMKTFLPLPLSLYDLERFGTTRFQQMAKRRSPLHYPLHPLICDGPKTPRPLVLIIIDSLRKDAIEKNSMPTLFAFKEQNQYAPQHFSGGNATSPGLFSLLYGLPYPYFDAVKSTKTPSILYPLLKNWQYETRVFSSSELDNPPLKQSVFLGIDEIKTHESAKTPDLGDKLVTKDFLAFLKTHKNTPFFTILFYDAAHAYCRSEFSQMPFQPAIKACNRLKLNNQSDPLPYLNRYKNALFGIDQNIQMVLEGLKKAGLSEKTLVIITGDHGQEFNDNHLNYWEHANNFTDIQIQTPFLLKDPLKEVQIKSKTSYHYDLIPSLMKNVLHCHNPSSDYSIGQNLDETKNRDYLWVSSYMTMGLIEKDKITTLFPSGQWLIQNRQALPLRNEKPNSQILKKALPLLSRYFDNTPNG